jgi:small subunit ribosomal protein S20
MRQAERRTARNQAARSGVRTYVKNASVAVSSSGDDVADVVRQAVRALDKAAQKGIIHRNAAARRKSRLMSRLHALSATPAEPKAAAKAPTSRRSAGTSKAGTARKPAARKTTARKPTKA